VIRLIFPSNSLSHLFETLLVGEVESCAIAYANPVTVDDQTTFLLVSEIFFPSAESYKERTTLSAVLDPSFIALHVKQATRAGQALVFIHTHPFSTSVPEFSPVDDSGEAALADFLEQRASAFPHLAAVLGPKGIRARILGKRQEVQVREVGSKLRLFDLASDELPSLNIFDRQVRAFGSAGQQAVEALKIGIVGLGGTGSAVAQQLTYLGAKKFLLIDPDTVDETSLNRLIGANHQSLEVPKVVVASHLIKSVHPDAEVTENTGTVLDLSVALSLVHTDLIFCCTDSHASRAILNQLAYQYYIPTIDMGVSIVASKGKVDRLTGRVQMLSPGLGCLACGNLLDADAIRRELMVEEHRKADPYFIGSAVPQPAVVTLNSTVASLAATMFLGAVTDIPAHARYQIYNGINGTLRAVSLTPDPMCIVCSKRGALGRGNEWELPARRA